MPSQGYEDSKLYLLFKSKQTCLESSDCLKGYMCNQGNCNEGKVFNQL